MPLPLNNNHNNNKDVTLIHILRFGAAWCKREGLTFEWPINEGWIAFNKEPSKEEKPKLCVHCVAAKKKYVQER